LTALSVREFDRLERLPLLGAVPVVRAARVLRRSVFAPVRDAVAEGLVVRERD
jgi:hypothetical protein